MSEKMREEFNEWYGKSWVPYSTRDDMWQAWQASRAALVVELPGAIWCSLAYHEAINDVKEALDDAGVGYK